MRPVSKECMLCVFRNDGRGAATHPPPQKSVTGEVGKCLEQIGQNFHRENNL